MFRTFVAEHEDVSTVIRRGYGEILGRASMLRDRLPIWEFLAIRSLERDVLRASSPGRSGLHSIR